MNIHDIGKKIILKKTGHLENSVVVGKSGKKLIIRPNVNIPEKGCQSKKGRVEKISGSWNFRPNVNDAENMNSQKKGHLKNEAPLIIVVKIIRYLLKIK